MDALSLLRTEPARKDRNRTITFEWELQTIGDPAAGLREVATLSCQHDPDRKQFFASLNQAKVTPTSFSFEIFAGVTVVRTACPRFSQKRLEEFAGLALDALTQAARAGDEKIVALFTPSDRSCGCTDRYHEAGCPVYAAKAAALNARRGR